VAKLNGDILNKQTRLSLLW